LAGPAGEAGSLASRFVARRMLKYPLMKDLLFIGITIAFFAVGWLYTKSFDRL
jgi:hypothetical protein